MAVGVGGRGGVGAVGVVIGHRARVRAALLLAAAPGRPAHAAAALVSCKATRTSVLKSCHENLGYKSKIYIYINTTNLFPEIYITK